MRLPNSGVSIPPRFSGENQGGKSKDSKIGTESKPADAFPSASRTDFALAERRSRDKTRKRERRGPRLPRLSRVFADVFIWMTRLLRCGLTLFRMGEPFAVREEILQVAVQERVRFDRREDPQMFQRCSQALRVFLLDRQQAPQIFFGEEAQVDGRF